MGEILPKKRCKSARVHADDKPNRKRRSDLTLASKVGARMRDFRLDRGLSLVQLHARGGPTPSQMSSIERGRVDVEVKTVVRVALALNMRPWQMLADDPDLASLGLGEAKRILFILPFGTA